jgi:hypothetical protein
MYDYGYELQFLRAGIRLAEMLLSRIIPKVNEILTLVLVSEALP